MSTVETIPAQYLNEPSIGYVYAALLSEHAQSKITELLESMRQELPGIIWTMPPDALHITLCEVIQSRKPYSEDKDTLFARRQDEYFDGAAHALKGISVLNVVFNQIEVSKDAIIIRTQDGAPFNDIRATLLSHISLPDETKRPPGIIHSSIARYQQAVDIETVQSVAASHRINFTEEITQFKLLRTTVPPLLEYEELTSFTLEC